MPDQFESGPGDDPGQMSPTPAPEVTLSPELQRVCSERQAEQVLLQLQHLGIELVVITMAGVQTFSPDAWCTDCGFYKVRRTPRKRPTPPPQDRYYY